MPIVVYVQTKQQLSTSGDVIKCEISELAVQNVPILHLCENSNASYDFVRVH